MSFRSSGFKVGKRLHSDRAQLSQNLTNITNKLIGAFKGQIPGKGVETLTPQELTPASIVTISRRKDVPFRNCEISLEESIYK